MGRKSRNKREKKNKKENEYNDIMKKIKRIERGETKGFVFYPVDTEEKVYYEDLLPVAISENEDKELYNKVLKLKEQGMDLEDITLPMVLFS